MEELLSFVFSWSCLDCEKSKLAKWYMVPSKKYSSSGVIIYMSPLIWIMVSIIFKNIYLLLFLCVHYVCLEAAVSHRVGAGNRTRVLQESKCLTAEPSLHVLSEYLI